jgi:hypothetical protein
MGAVKRRYVTKAGAVNEYRYAAVKGLPYKEYRRDEWKLLQQERTLHRTPLAEAEAERAQQLHRDGVGPTEIAKQLVRTM